MKSSYCNKVREHYAACWQTEIRPIPFDKGPIGDLPADFQVLLFSPRVKRKMWTYATQCMSQLADKNRLELHVFAPEQNDDIAELLVATAHYHRTGRQLNIGDTVYFGRPWWPGSQCDHGLLSLPYLDGPKLEWLKSNDYDVRFLWLIPITPDELRFKRDKGVEALESLFHKTHFNYLDPVRPSVC